MTLEPAVAARAARIRPHLERAADSILAAGVELARAKEELAHGQFGPLLDELGMAPRVAQKFMAIARSTVLGNATPGSHLPTGLTVLYELSRVPDEVLEAAIESGEVNPSTTRAEAAALRYPAGDKDATDPDDRGERLARAMASMDPDELEDILAFADASPERFEMALSEARAEGDLSRENLRRWLDRPVGPLAQEEQGRRAKCEATIAAAGEREGWWYGLAIEVADGWMEAVGEEERTRWLSRLANAASRVPLAERHGILLQVWPDYEPDAPEIVKAGVMTIFAGVAAGFTRDGWTDPLLQVDLAATLDDLEGASR